MLPVELTSAEICKNAVVSCPIKDFKPRRASNCEKCEHYQGLAVMGVEGNWSDKYAIRCNHVIERRTHNLEIIED